MRKLTNIEALERLQIKFPGLDCSEVQYRDAHTSVKLTCRKHNHTFNVSYAYAMGSRCKYGCVHCQSDSYRLSHDEVIKRFVKAHGEKYNYSRVQYKNNLAKVEIICRTHGSFMQVASAHWLGHGCVKCAVDNGRHGPGGYNTETLKDSNALGVVYVLKINDTRTYYKIGISKISGAKRVKDNALTKKAVVLYQSERILLKDAYRIEQEMLSKYNRYRYNKNKISGWTEVIDVYPDINLLKEKIKNAKHTIPI